MSAGVFYSLASQNYVISKTSQSHYFCDRGCVRPRHVDANSNRFLFSCRSFITNSTRGLIIDIKRVLIWVAAALQQPVPWGILLVLSVVVSAAVCKSAFDRLQLSPLSLRLHLSLQPGPVCLLILRPLLRASCFSTQGTAAVSVRLFWSLVGGVILCCSSLFWWSWSQLMIIQHIWRGARIWMVLLIDTMSWIAVSGLKATLLQRDNWFLCLVSLQQLTSGQCDIKTQLFFSVAPVCLRWEREQCIFFVHKIWSSDWCRIDRKCILGNQHSNS